MRSVLPLPCIFAAVLGLLLAGCMRAPSADVAPGQRLVIALPTDITTLDPHMTAAVGSNLSVLGHLYQSLVSRGPDLKLHGELATRWEAVAPDRWRFHLVPGQRFADGEPLDAAAVKWNLDRVRDKAVHARIGLWFEPVTDVVVLDAKTLDIQTRGPFPSLPAQLSMFFLLPPTWAATHDPARDAMPSGPYRITENVPGDHLTLRRNRRYTGAMAPAFDEIVFRVIPSATARVAALLAGEVDLVTSLPLTEVARIRASGQANAGSVPSIRTVFLKLNTLQPPLDNPLVRQALNYAVDKQSIADALFDGQAPLAPCQLPTPEYFGFNPALKPIPYDPARARSLLKQAGVAPGTRIPLEVPVGYYLQGEEVTQAVAAQLKEVGLDVQLVQLDPSTYMDKYLKARALGPMSLLTYAWPSLDADGLLSLMDSKSPYAYWNDAPFDALLRQGRETLDTARRLDAYRQATARMCEQAPVVFLYVQPATYGSSHRIRWEARGDDWLRATDMHPANAGPVPSSPLQNPKAP
jgi:peptide/nickel transport system substrate-binding protein